MNAHQADLFPETLLVTRRGDRVFTTSLKVAEHFKKRHTHVLRAIEKLLSDLGGQAGGLDSEADASQPNFEAAEGAFSQPNFGLAEDFRHLNFAAARYLDAQKKPREMYEMTHDGFALLAMGFTGREALAWKVQFLAAFRAMEREVHALKERESNALYHLRPRWRPILLHPKHSRSQLIELTGHKSPGAITACRRRMREAGLLPVSGE